MKIVISNVFGPLNLGDFELFKSLVSKIDLDEHDVSAIARDPLACSKYFESIEFHEQLGKAPSKLRRIFYLFCSYLFLSFPSIAIQFLPKSQSTALLKLKESDLVIGCPGGFLEDSTFSFYTHLLQLYIATKLSKRVVLSPMSIGPARSIINKFLLKKVLTRVDDIFVRELVSSKLCDRLSLPYTLSNDMAFEEKVNKDCSERKNLALFTIIDWNFPTSSNPQEEFDSYINSLVSSALFINRKYGFEIAVIQQVASDKRAIDAFSERLSTYDVNVEINGEGMTPNEIMDYIRSSRIVIASRFHSAIFSINTKTPVVAISYLPKTTGMLELYNASELCLDIVDLKSSSINEKVDAFLNDDDSFNDIHQRIFNNISLYSRFDVDDFISRSKK